MKRQNKSVKILGKTYKYKGIPDLSRQIDIGEDSFEKRMNTEFILDNINREKIIYQRNTGQVAKIDLHDNPVIIREFLGVKRLYKDIKKDIINEREFNHQNVIFIRDKTVQFDKYTATLNMYFEATVYIRISDSWDMRTIKGTYVGRMGDNEYIFKHLAVYPQYPNKETYKYNLQVFHNQHMLNGKRSGDRPYKQVNYTLAYSTKYDTRNDNDEADFKQALMSVDIHKADFFDTCVDLPKEQIDSGLFTAGLIRRIMGKYPACGTIVVDNVRMFTKENGDEFSLARMRLLKVDSDNISVNLFGDIIIDINVNDGSTCVESYLCTMYKRINVKKYFDNLDLDLSEGIDTNQIIDFCKKYGIKCVAYNVSRNVIASYYPKHPNKNHRSLIFIAHNNHMYPIKNKYLNKKSHLKKFLKPEFEYNNTVLLSDEKINESFKELIDNRIMPAEPCAHTTRNEKIPIQITSYIHEKSLYFSNKDYNDCVRILDAFGLKDKITPTTTRYNLMPIIEELYGTSNLGHCFFPQLNDNILKADMYHTDETNIDMTKTRTDDKNKAYMYSLSLLPFVMSIDSRKVKINSNPVKIIDKYLYYVKPSCYSHLIPKTGYYSGFFLNKVKPILDTKCNLLLLSEYETLTDQNNFTLLVDDYYNHLQKIINELDDKKIIKDAANIWLGKLEREIGNDSFCKIEKICNNEEMRLSNDDEFPLPYNDKYQFSIKNHSYSRITNRKLLKLQIMEMSRWCNYQHMVELKLKPSDIIQISTDAVTYKFNDNTPILNYDITDYKAWKQINYKRARIPSNQYHDDKQVFYGIPHLTHNILHDGYAGSGKTHTIINNVIPELIRAGVSYVVTSPTHISLSKYRKAKINCKVLQSYYFTKTIPKEDVVIVDEIGLCNRECQDIIFRCYLAGKTLLCWGDYKQLLGPFEVGTYNNKQFIDMLFDEHKIIKTNHRNKFTTEYYDQLINKEINLIAEMTKYSLANYYDAEAIICYTNTQCDEWNEKYINYHNIHFGDINSKVICRTNTLRKYDIYNNFIMTITDKDDEFVTLDEVYKIPIDLFTQKTCKHQGNFGLAYARTQYNVQGESLKSFYIPPECYESFNNGRSAYTIISRYFDPTVEHTEEKTIHIIKHKFDLMNISSMLFSN